MNNTEYKFNIQYYYKDSCKNSLIVTPYKISVFVTLQHNFQF